MTATESDPAASPPETPLLRVVTGDPTDEELAALVAVVSALAGAARPPAGPPRRPEWSARHRLVRGVHRHGPGAWRASAR
ncbi:Acyl-CoA carboxylase epsilon subunit [Nocardioides scoriae]|uniref:Acyl-CoA carboxylase epsilon subunit n=1 Tax=Nocardioides scoriae TaxID=642780 RepID=A0A1H1R8P8_9ACTN|nr:acyl-CoA carboxylase subunit epsilon [Nocardioides scoriae]SDS32073.1 Acyl-CoA carboxylase epsilon subunit [Nocardioides scoriae]